MDKSRQSPVEAPHQVFDLMQQLRAAGTPFALVTVVRSLAPTSAKPGEKALVTADGGIHGWIGGGCAQPAVIKTVKQALEDGEPRLIRVSPKADSQQGVEGIVDFNMGCYSGGTLDLFIDPVIPAPVVQVLGASPVARHLSELAARVGFRVQALAPDTVAEDFPAATWHADGVTPPAAWPQAAWAVVATQGRGDRAALESALAGSAGRIAFVASRRKRARLEQDLLARGASAQRLAAVQTPAGLEIGARTPAEIALSVVAQLVQWRRLQAVDVPATAPPMADPAMAAPAPATQPAGGCCGGGA